MKFSLIAGIAILPIFASAQGFKGTCSNLNLSGQQQLGASCLTESKQGLYTALNLGRCVGNNDGKLFSNKNGGYDGSCRQCRIERDSAWLNCMCRNRAGGEINSRLDLNGLISNHNGIMVCTTGERSSWPPAPETIPGPPVTMRKF